MCPTTMGSSPPFGCDVPSSRRFKYLFGAFSPAGIVMNDNINLEARLICKPYMYALYVCLLKFITFVVSLCRSLYVCLLKSIAFVVSRLQVLICMPYMYALYVCLICMPYICAFSLTFPLFYVCCHSRRILQQFCEPVSHEECQDCRFCIRAHEILHRCRAQVLKI